MTYYHLLFKKNKEQQNYIYGKESQQIEICGVDCLTAQGYHLRK